MGEDERLRSAAALAGSGVLVLTAIVAVFFALVALLERHLAATALWMAVCVTCILGSAIIVVVSGPREDASDDR